MKREDFQSELFIYPRGDWRCWICLKEMLNLELFAETEKEVLLICVPCYERTVLMLKYELAVL